MRTLTAQEIVNKICEDRDRETVRAMRRLSKKVEKDNPHGLHLQLLIQYSLLK